MNELEILPDDPRLTAYALGELEGDERATIEAALRRSSELRAAMEEIRATTAQIEAALAAEAAEAELLEPPLPLPAESFAILPGRDARKFDGGPLMRGPAGRGHARATILSFPRSFAIAGGLVAACFAVLLAVREQTAGHRSGGRGDLPRVAVAPSAPVTEPERVAEASVSVPAPTGRRGVAPESASPTQVAPERSEMPTLAVVPEISPAQPTPMAVTDITSSAPTTAATPGADLPTQSAERPADGLALLNQVRSEQAEPAAPELATQPIVQFDPLPALTGPLIPQLALSPPPVGLPTTAREPQLPVVVESAREEPNTRGQAMLRLQNDAVRVAHLRGTGSEAERARLLADAQRGGSRGDGDSTARERGSKAGAARESGGFWSRIAGRRNRGAANPATHELRERPQARGPAGGAMSIDGGISDNGFIPAAQQPNSSFPVAVANESYSELRQALLNRTLPPASMVRIEEMLNHFSYRYNEPAVKGWRAFVGSAPPAFAATLEVAEAPWAPAHRLVRIGLKGRAASGATRQAPIAKDAAIQVEFNPAKVASYRLIGFEGGAKTASAVDDSVQAGEVEAGYAVTALYEIVPTGEGKASPALTALLTVTLRYTEPTKIESKVLEFPLTDAGTSFANASADFKFTAAVAGFGMILRDSPHKGGATLDRVLDWATSGLAGVESEGSAQRQEFIALARQAQALWR